MGKGAFIKRMVAVRNYSTNTIMEKKQRGMVGNVKDMEFSWVKTEKYIMEYIMENIAGIIHPVLLE